MQHYKLQNTENKKLQKLQNTENKKTLIAARKNILSSKEQQTKSW